MNVYVIAQKFVPLHVTDGQAQEERANSLWSSVPVIQLDDRRIQANRSLYFGLLCLCETSK
jgi:hypothetical protein